LITDRGIGSKSGIGIESRTELAVMLEQSLDEIVTFLGVFQKYDHSSGDTQSPTNPRLQRLYEYLLCRKDKARKLVVARYGKYPHLSIRFNQMGGELVEAASNPNFLAGGLWLDTAIANTASFLYKSARSNTHLAEIYSAVFANPALPTGLIEHVFESPEFSEEVKFAAFSGFVKNPMASNQYSELSNYLDGWSEYKHHRNQESLVTWFKSVPKQNFGDVQHLLQRYLTSEPLVVDALSSVSIEGTFDDSWFDGDSDKYKWPRKQDSRQILYAWVLNPKLEDGRLVLSEDRAQSLAELRYVHFSCILGWAVDWPRYAWFPNEIWDTCLTEDQSARPPEYLLPDLQFLRFKSGEECACPVISAIEYYLEMLGTEAAFALICNDSFKETPESRRFYEQLGWFFDDHFSDLDFMFTNISRGRLEEFDEDEKESVYLYNPHRLESVSGEDSDQSKRHRAFLQSLKPEVSNETGAQSGSWSTLTQIAKRHGFFAFDKNGLRWNTAAANLNFFQNEETGKLELAALSRLETSFSPTYSHQICFDSSQFGHFRPIRLFSKDKNRTRSTWTESVVGVCRIDRLAIDEEVVVHLSQDNFRFNDKTRLDSHLAIDLNLNGDRERLRIPGHEDKDVTDLVDRFLHSEAVQSHTDLFVSLPDEIVDHFRVHPEHINYPFDFSLNVFFDWETHGFREPSTRLTSVACIPKLGINPSANGQVGDLIEEQLAELKISTTDVIRDLRNGQEELPTKLDSCIAVFEGTLRSVLEKAQLLFDNESEKASVFLKQIRVLCVFIIVVLVIQVLA